MTMLFTPGKIGSLTLPNRLVRSATAEGMADADGRPRPRLRALYQELARGGVGLIVTGHMYVHPSGKAHPGMSGIYLGRPVDFPWFGIADDLGPEGVLLRSGGEGVLVLGHPGHAVSSFLHHLGCRWFFPGDVWEVLPREPTLTVRLSRRESPAFPIQRRIWYGFGAYPKCRADKSAWDGRNRLGGSVRVAIGHTWGSRPWCL